MRLKAFETYGFKSFAERTEINFEEGITAIVGPNGSGKSNISDAIRLVLGEQSAKYLRGNKMEDVIFAGTNKRRALGMAEVNLVFDNSDHRIPSDFDEINVCRRVFRSGDSEYYINKKPCRLKDIVDLFSDTGLGRGSMSIIGQNRIDEILNSRPEERRALFEEAAGIAKYRLRKKEATLRLTETANNITRIYDIKSEIEGRIEPLRISAEKTQKYLKMSDELRSCRVTQVVHKLQNIEEINEKLAIKIAELNKRNEEITVSVNLRENSVLILKTELDKLNEEFTELQNSIAERETLLEKLHGQEAVLNERILQSQKSQERLQAQRERLVQQLSEIESNLKNIIEKYDALETEQQAAQSAVNKYAAEQANKEKLIADTDARIVDYKSSAFESMQQIVDLRNEIRSLENEQENRQRKREQLKKTLADLEEAYNLLTERHKNIINEQQSITNSIAIDQGQMSELVAKNADDQRALGEVVRKRNSLNEALSSLQTRVDLLENMQRVYDGFGRSIKTLLSSESAWRNGIIGVVAELFQVQAPYVTAIETALGGAVQNLVTKDVATAKQAIEFLKKTKDGRATFLPLDTIRPTVLRNDEAALVKLPGIVGVASELVQCEENLLPVANFLLGRVLVAKNMDAAIMAAKANNYRLRIVTLEGELINPGGSITGGSSRHKESGFLSRKNEIILAKENVNNINRQILATQENIETCEELVKHNNSRIEEFKSLLQKNKVRQAELSAHLERAAAEIAQHKENIALYEQEKRQHSEDYINTRNQLLNLKPALAELEEKDLSTKELVDKLQQELSAEQRALNIIRTHYQNACITLESAKERTNLISERIKQIDGDIARLQLEISNNDAENEKMVQVVDQSASTKEQLAIRQKDLLAELKNDNGGKEEFTNKRLGIVEKLAIAEGELEAARKEYAASTQKLHLAEMEKVKQQTEYETALEQIATTYNITLAEAKDSTLLLDLSDSALKKMESGLTRAIEELGPINAGAIEEYKTVSERYEFLNAQYNDLYEAKERLEEVINDINANMSRRFKESLTKINAHFAETYKNLFGGGMASLELQNPDNILDSGIEIIVQPPGKKLQSLFLLSGGERALTVIALLFALLSYQPAPFCILDEIDAALDEANIDRFSAFLADYAKKTQFIIITHRKGIMEAADVLHGITMEESGISRLLSVRLEEKG
ncbi:MAG: chromosome segregation protein SMC [Acholeplasmataceae bacterium]|nr:chromosome segregation protein SMC [Acholeplasmataceae bacterium]